MPKAHAALLVADDHEGGERETTAPLHGGGDAVDVHQLLDDVGIGAFFSGVAAVAIAAIVAAAAL